MSITANVSAVGDATSGRMVTWWLIDMAVPIVSLVNYKVGTNIANSTIIALYEGGVRTCDFNEIRWIYTRSLYFIRLQCNRTFIETLWWRHCSRPGTKGNNYCAYVVGSLNGVLDSSCNQFIFLHKNLD